MLEGVLAPETAAHAAGVSALLPMITLGIPGSPTAAVMLGGLLIWGLQPGPMLFKERPDFVWGLIASMYTGNVIGVLIVLLFVPAFAAILRMPFAILIPVIVYVCAIGACGQQQHHGYLVHADFWGGRLFLQEAGLPDRPMVLALVLGDMAESALRQSLIMSQGSPLIFVTRPISVVLVVLSLGLFVSPGIQALLRRWRQDTSRQLETRAEL